MNIAFVAQRHENFVFPPTAILEIQTDRGKKHQGGLTMLWMDDMQFSLT